MTETTRITLLPLSRALHTDAVQQLYRATPGYWEMYNLPGAPAGQAALDLEAAEATPGRTMMGMLRPLNPEDPDGGAELIGLVDFRLHWPGETLVYLGMFMVAEALQRQGIATQAWRLLAPWLRDQAGIHKARCGVEQFNVGALQFMQSLGFQLTGETNRLAVGDKFVRLLYMEHHLVTPA